MTILDLTGTVLGFLLTCMVLSYIFGDNPLFRFSVYLLVGVAAGFAGAVAVRNVISPISFFHFLRSWKVTIPSHHWFQSFL
ncbi:MAG: hypothetical protein HC806_06945 [Anaerolineae bacterium]|nr:hypothetical protein [Anaerolineae bacterium]